MGTLVMAVTIVQAGKRIAASITLVTNGWGRRGLDCCPRSGRKRRRVRVLENSRRDEWGYGDVLIRRTVVILLALLVPLLLMRHVGLGRRRL